MAESALGPLLLGQGRVRRQAHPLPRRWVDDLILEQEEAKNAGVSGSFVRTKMPPSEIGRRSARSRHRACNNRPICT